MLLKAAQRELATLEQIALVQRTRRGRQVFFRVETEHPLFADLRALLLKSGGLALPRQEALERVRGVQAAAIYGSVASGTDTGRSDIDLLVEFDDLEPVDRADAYFGLLADLEALFGRPVDLVERSALRNPVLRRSVEASQVTLYEAA